MPSAWYLLLYGMFLCVLPGVAPGEAVAATPGNHARCEAAGQTPSVFPDRLFLRTISIAPPTGADWCVDGPDAFLSAVFVRLHSSEMPVRGSHSYFVAAMLDDVDGKVPDTLAGLQALIQRWIDSGAHAPVQLSGKPRLTFAPGKGSERFTLTRGRAVADTSIGLECVRYDLGLEERDNPGIPGVLVIEAAGLFCLLPNSPDELLELTQSERYPADQRPTSPMMMSGAPQAEAFYSSVLLTMPEDAAQESAVHKVAERGVSQAQFSMGLLAQYRRHYDEARQWYEKAARAGNVGALNNLGVLYTAGMGVAEDHAQAAKWLELAADRGSAEAEYQLGVFYWLGDGVPVDQRRATDLMRAAADQGMPIAMVNMGEAYREGIGGLPIDPVKACGWYILGRDRAANEPDIAEIASKLLAALEATLSPEQRLAAKDWAARWSPGAE